MSNSPQNIEKFSLKTVREKRNQLIAHAASQVAVARRPNSSSVIDALIALGNEATSTNATARNKAVSRIMEVYKHNKIASEYILPGNSWTFTSRFAVYWAMPVTQQISFSKHDTASVLAKFSPMDFPITSIGYHQAYAYSVKPTAPNREVWTQYCIYGTEGVFREISRIKGLVYVPPQLPNMLNKLATNLSKTLKPCPPDRLKQVVTQSSCVMQDDINYFQDCGRESIPIVQAVVDWCLKCEPHKATPGFPYSCLVKKGGFTWGTVSESNTPLMLSVWSVIERFVTRLLAACQKNKCLDNPEKSFKIGEQLYALLYSKKEMVYDKELDNEENEKGKIATSLLPHCVWTLSSGNVKPVAVEDIKAGKPDRSVFMSPAMIRFSFMRLSQQVSAHWKHSSKLTSFGWQKGGSDVVVNKLFTQFGFEEDDFWDKAEFHSPAGQDTFDITFPQACFFAPDIKAQDNHYDSSFFSIFYKVIMRDFVQVIPTKYACAVAAMLGFMNAVEVSPIILTNANIFFYPHNLNPSGGPFTSQHSQNQSTVLGNEAKDYQWYESVKVAHLSSGDDAILALWSNRKDLHFGLRGMTLEEVNDINKVTENNKKNPYNVINTETLKRGTVLEFGNKQMWKGMAGFAAHIRSKYAIEFKPDTLKIHHTLSSVEFLGAHITVIPTADYGIPALVASRPLHKALFTVLWPKQHPTEGVSAQTTAAMRAMAVYYDIALVNKAAASMMYQVYSHFKKGAAGTMVAPPSYKYYESDFCTVPTDKFLPELPPLGEIFTWMTGLQPATRQVDSIEGGDFEGDFVEEKEVISSGLKIRPKEELIDLDDFEGDFIDEEDIPVVSPVETPAPVSVDITTLDQTEIAKRLRPKYVSRYVPVPEMPDKDEFALERTEMSDLIRHATIRKDELTQLAKRKPLTALQTAELSNLTVDLINMTKEMKDLCDNYETQIAEVKEAKLVNNRVLREQQADLDETVGASDKLKAVLAPQPALDISTTRTTTTSAVQSVVKYSNDNG